MCYDVSEQSRVKHFSNFKVGDTVKITRKANSYENGWENSWATKMTDLVGKTGKVVGISTYNSRDVDVSVPGYARFGFPEFVLEKVETEKPAPKLKEDVKLAATFHPGDRVRVTYTDYESRNEGRIATVIAIEGSGYVRVKFSEQEYTPNLFPQRLTKISSAPTVTTPVPVYGNAVKASLKNAVFTAARLAAVALAKKNGQTNADEVQAELASKGYSSTQLGNAAGAIFQGKNWKKVGAIKSTRQGNNRRTISTWQYVGA